MLYHLDDPVPVLTDLARVTDRIVVWTHVYNDEFGMERLADRFDPTPDPETARRRDTPNTAPSKAGSTLLA